jgi:hypothetical protein
MDRPNVQYDEHFTIPPPLPCTASGNFLMHEQAEIHPSNLNAFWLEKLNKQKNNFPKEKCGSRKFKMELWSHRISSSRTSLNIFLEHKSSSVIQRTNCLRLK